MVVRGDGTSILWAAERIFGRVVAELYSLSLFPEGLSFGRWKDRVSELHGTGDPSTRKAGSFIEGVVRPSNADTLDRDRIDRA